MNPTQTEKENRIETADKPAERFAHTNQEKKRSENRRKASKYMKDLNRRNAIGDMLYMVGTDDGQILHRTVEDGRFGIAQHQAHGPALDQEDRGPCDGAVARLDDAAVPDALSDAVGAARTVVLANISRHGHADALHG